MKDLTRRLVGGLFWMTTSTAGQGVMQFFIFALLARVLRPEVFGVITAGQSFILLVQILFQLGFGYVLIQKQDIEKEEIDCAFTMSLFLGLIGGVVIYFLAEQVSSFFGMETLDGYMRLMAITIPFQGYIATTEALLKKNMKFKTLASIQIVSYFISYGVIGIYLAYAGYEGWTLAIAFTSQYVMTSLLMRTYVTFNRKLTFNWRVAKSLVTFGGSYTISECFFSLATYSDKAIIGKFIGDKFLGYYGRAYRIMLLPSSFFGKVVDQVLLPGISLIQNDKERLSKLYFRGLSLASSLLIPGTVFLYLLAPEIIDVALGSQWEGAVPVFRILVCVIYFRTGFNVADSLAKGLGLYKERMIGTVLFALITIMATFIGVETSGAHGAVYGVCFGIVANYFIMTFYIMRVINFSFARFVSAHCYGILALIPTTLIALVNIYYIKTLPTHSIFKLGMNTGFIALVFIFFYKMKPDQEIRWLITTMFNSLKINREII